MECSHDLVHGILWLEDGEAEWKPGGGMEREAERRNEAVTLIFLAWVAKCCVYPITYTCMYMYMYP